MIRALGGRTVYEVIFPICVCGVMLSLLSDVTKESGFKSFSIESECRLIRPLELTGGSDFPVESVRERGVRVESALYASK